MEATKEALRVDPKYANALYNLATFKLEGGRTEEALEALRDAVAIDPSLKDRARGDTDLDRLRGLPEFDRLIEPIDVKL